MTSPVRSPGLLAVALLALGLPGSSAALRTWEGPSLASSQRSVVATTLQAMRRALDRCEWERASQLADLVRGIEVAGSDAWLEASAGASLALYWAGERDGALERALEVSHRIELRDSQAGEPGALGAIPPAHRSSLGMVELIAAGVLQHQERHEEALRRLDPFIARSRTAGHASREMLADALFEAARARTELGEEEAAKRHLIELRDGFGDLTSGAAASVLLQQGPDGVRAYRGRYRGDRAHFARMEAVREAIPEARRKLAALMGREEEGLPSFPIGVADSPAGVEHIGGFTVTDPRSGQHPLIVLFPRVLALELIPLGEILVHELAHALLAHELGLAYERLPRWVAEGISSGLAGQWDGYARALLAIRVRDDARGFVREDFIESLTLELSEGPCGRVRPTASLALWCLEPEETAGEALPRLVRALYEGLSLDEALLAVCGMDAEQFLDHAGRELRRRLAARREAMLPFVLDVLAAEPRGHAEVLRVCERALAADPPDDVLGFLLWRKVKALELSGRAEEALLVHERIGRDPRLLLTYAEAWRIGHAWCLLALQRDAEAYPALLALRRDALDASIRQWAEARIAELGRTPHRSR